MNLETGLEACQKLCDALGIDWRNRPVHRIVLDFKVGEVPKVYVAEYLQAGALDTIATQAALAEVIPVADLIVDERTGDVTCT